jgi:3-deoxy-manno-octulosonate cytidylyltransferase (CMP-KDO synthetase)
LGCFYKHIGIYAFKSDVLRSFASLPQSNLEKIEKLEQLRLLQNGYKIRCAETDVNLIGIDTFEDLEKAREFVKSLPSLE